MQRKKINATFAEINGIRTNKVLKRAANIIEKEFKSDNLETRFEMAFDGVWEYVIKNVEHNVGFVCRESSIKKNHQEVYSYQRRLDSISDLQPAQLQHDQVWTFKNKKIAGALKTLVAGLQDL